MKPKIPKFFCSRCDRKKPETECFCEKCINDIINWKVAIKLEQYHFKQWNKFKSETIKFTK